MSLTSCLLKALDLMRGSAIAESPEGALLRMTGSRGTCMGTVIPSYMALRPTQHFQQGRGSVHKCEFCFVLVFVQSCLRPQHLNLNTTDLITMKRRETENHLVSNLKLNASTVKVRGKTFGGITELGKCLANLVINLYLLKTQGSSFL